MDTDKAAPPYYLMIGDSISLGYLAGVEKQLSGNYTVVHSAGNAGNMNKISHDLKCFLSQVAYWRCCLPAPFSVPLKRMWEAAQQLNSVSLSAARRCQAGGRAW